MQEQKKLPNQKTKIVKLYVYQIESEKTFVDTYEQNDFDDFIIVSGNFSEDDRESISEMHAGLKESTGKTVLIVDKSADLALYGVRELEEEE